MGSFVICTLRIILLSSLNEPFLGYDTWTYLCLQTFFDGLWWFLLNVICKWNCSCSLIESGIEASVNIWTCSLQLKFLSYEELQQRMANLDAEMEREIDELRRRYQTKRQPILDAMDQKRKRQQNFWEKRQRCLAGVGSHSKHSSQSRCNLGPAIPPDFCYKETF